MLRLIIKYNNSLITANKMEVEALERLHLVHARLLYIIAEMHSENLIDEVQKVNLKSNFSLLSSLVRVFKDEK